jgi:hypothetical protein
VGTEQQRGLKASSKGVSRKKRKKASVGKISKPVGRARVYTIGQAQWRGKV